jgi:hypothetical protein
MGRLVSELVFYSIIAVGLTRVHVSLLVRQREGSFQQVMFA